MTTPKDIIKPSLEAGLGAALLSIIAYATMFLLELGSDKLYSIKIHYEPLHLIIYAIINWLSFSYNSIKKIKRKNKLNLFWGSIVALIIISIAYNIVSKLILGVGYFEMIFKRSIQTPFSFLLPIILIIIYTAVLFTLFQKKDLIRISFWLIMVTILVTSITTGFILDFSSEAFFELIIAVFLFITFIILNYYLKIKDFKEDSLINS